MVHLWTFEDFRAVGYFVDRERALLLAEIDASNHSRDYAPHHRALRPDGARCSHRGRAFVSLQGVTHLLGRNLSRCIEPEPLRRAAFL